MKEVKAYKCDHCEKKVFTKAYMKKHEPICFHNVDTKSCVTCDNFKQDIYEPKQHKSRWCEKEINIEAELKTNCQNYTNIEALTGSERF